MSDDLHIFRSAGPSVFAAWATFKEANAEWCCQRDDVLSRLDPTGKRGAMVTTGFGSRRFVGLSHQSNWPIPEGWRVEPKRWDVIVPRRSTKKGKAIAKVIDAVQPPRRPPLPGMPGDHFTGLSFLSPGIEEHDRYLYVLWGGEKPPEGIDAALWAPVKRSEWYALLEDEEARV